MGAQDNVNPHQLQMFMTPNEIHAQYQPLDGDREERDVWSMDRTDYTNRSRNTRGESNWGIYNQQNEYAKGRKFQYNPGTETDTELWDRKLEESQMTKADYDEKTRGEYREPEFTGGGDRTGAPQYRTDHTRTYESQQDSWDQSRARSHDAKVSEYYEGGSLHESVEKEGVQYPLHLGTSIGTQGKPQIAGGHHRLAAATNINPNQFIPVIHHEGATGEARESAKSGGYEYR